MSVASHGFISILGRLDCQHLRREFRTRGGPNQGGDWDPPLGTLEDGLPGLGSVVSKKPWMEGVPQAYLRD